MAETGKRVKAFRTGLVVGKFAPLHCGHQFLIEEAQHRCEKLVVLSYSVPDFPGCEAGRRERWLSALYPSVQVVVLDDARLAHWCAKARRPRARLPANDDSDDTHRSFVGWILREMLGTTVDVVFTSESYGEGLAKALGTMQGTPVLHVEVDRERKHHPVSGTAIRADVHAKRELLHPVVYADFVERVAVLGGEATGKTTLARSLAQKLGTAWVPEYGRELWEARDGHLAFGDMVDIARAQVEREQAVARRASQYLICDTTPLTTLFYAQAMFGEVTPELAMLANRRYDYTLFCADDFEFVQDGTRQGAEFRARQQAWYADEFCRRGIQVCPVPGSLENRLAVAGEFLAKGE